MSLVRRGIIRYARVKAIVRSAAAGREATITSQHRRPSLYNQPSSSVAPEAVFDRLFIFNEVVQDYDLHQRSKSFKVTIVGHDFWKAE